jgi:urease accessory protein
MSMPIPPPRVRRLLPLLAASLCLGLSAFAHPGHGPHGPDEIDEFARSALGAGLLHPWTGLDHVLTILGLGLVALTARAEPRGLVSILFGASLMGGFALARAQTELPLLEPLLALTVAALGLAACFPRAGGWRLLAVLLAGLYHGNAHGTEMAAGLSGAAYLAGFLLAHLVPAFALTGLARFLHSPQWQPRPRQAGTALAVMGLVLCLARIA